MVRGDNPEDLERFDSTNLCSFCMSIMSDPDFLKDLNQFTADPALLKKVAIERFFLLQEPEMLAGLKNRNMPGPVFEQGCHQSQVSVELLEKMP
jgi:hypothetical protein